LRYISSSPRFPRRGAGALSQPGTDSAEADWDEPSVSVEEANDAISKVETVVAVESALAAGLGAAEAGRSRAISSQPCGRKRLPGARRGCASIEVYRVVTGDLEQFEVLFVRSPRPVDQSTPRQSEVMVARTER
jgi:hypothetical protein